jgi:hypothetical protein
MIRHIEKMTFLVRADGALQSTKPDNLIHLTSVPTAALAEAYADETGSNLPRSSVPASTLASHLSLRNAVLDDRFRFGNRLTPFIQSPRAASSPASPYSTTLSNRKLRALLTTPGPPPFQDRVVQPARACIRGQVLAEVSRLPPRPVPSRCHPLDSPHLCAISLVYQGRSLPIIALA